MDRHNSAAPITYKELQQIHQNYLKNAATILQKATGQEATRTVWFELSDDFRSFLRKCADDRQLSGLKVYLCQYAADAAEVDKRNSVTVAFVPTEQSQTTGADEDVTGETEDEETSFNHGKICPPDC